MKLTWHLIVIVVAVILGFCLWHKGAEKDDMTDKQLHDAHLYRRVAGVLWAVAVGVFAVWLYKLNNQKLGNMCGGGMRAFMNGNTNHTNHLGSHTNHENGGFAIPAMYQPARRANMHQGRPNKVYRHGVVDLDKYLSDM